MAEAPKLLMIQGEEWAEAKPTTPFHPVYGACAQCAFGQQPRMCVEAIQAAPAAFGGDCDDRDVVYMRAEVSR